jgi:hypothetical protein
MGHEAWKKRERMIALACGADGRFPAPHGPDFVFLSRCGELKAEVKLRKKPPTATLERWLSAADVLFTCAGGRKTNNALVTMRLSTFLEHFALPVETEDNDDG